MVLLHQLCAGESVSEARVCPFCLCMSVMVTKLQFIGLLMSRMAGKYVSTRVAEEKPVVGKIE